jgi:hypothetical protein
MKKRKGFRAGTSSIRADYRTGGLVARKNFNIGGFTAPAAIKTKQQFYSDYEQEKGKPPSGGKAGGAKRRADYAAEQEQAYTDYLTQSSTGLATTPVQSKDAFRAEYEKTNPAPKGRRVYYKIRDAWNADFNQAYDKYLNTTAAEIGTAQQAAYAQQVKDSEAAIAEARATRGQTEAQIQGDNMALTPQQKAANRAKLNEALAGKVPVAGQIPAVQKVDDTIYQKGTTMAGPTEVGQTQVAQTPDEQFYTVGTTQTGQAPTVSPASTVEASQVAEAPTVTAAQTQVDDQAIATTAGVQDVPTIEAAKVQIKEGDLTNRVVGTLSPEAMATAAQSSGTTLARVSRAKKQLRTAGLDEAAITALGENPEALEDRLTDFTEAQRGVIEGLPEEALVSNQIDSLLKGIENGEIPTWASPAVAAVEQMLAQRGLEASSVGRDGLVNAIIQSSIPIAQANAQAIQQSVAQEKTLIAQEELANTQLRQQTALQNASNVFQLDLAQFSADQQTALSNSKFLQTTTLTDTTNEQQAIIQNAAILAQVNLAEADINTKLALQNAQAFLQTDLANLNNAQQANVLRAQQEQQRMLSNQAAVNAAAQFNASSENQTNQFMANLAAQMSQFNANQQNATAQFNATQANAAAARNAQRTADVNRLNAQLQTQIEQFNANQDFARNQWNAQNTAAVEASNVQWRRQANTANTAAQNAVNLQNAQNAFNLSNAAQAFLWQELRDEADHVFRSTESEKDRIASIVNTALASDPDSFKNIESLKNLVGAIITDIV